MRKRKKKGKLSMQAAQRKALLRGLARNLFLKEKIRTTQARAKVLRPLAEKLITKAKRGNLAARRHILIFLDKRVAKKLMDEIAPKYKERSGGYTRIIKLGPRKSDGARMAILELV